MQERNRRNKTGKIVERKPPRPMIPLAMTHLPIELPLSETLALAAMTPKRRRLAAAAPVLERAPRTAPTVEPIGPRYEHPGGEAPCAAVANAETAADKLGAFDRTQRALVAIETRRYVKGRKASARRTRGDKQAERVASNATLAAARVEATLLREWYGPEEAAEYVTAHASDADALLRWTAYAEHVGRKLPDAAQAVADMVSSRRPVVSPYGFIRRWIARRADRQDTRAAERRAEYRAAMASRHLPNIDGFRADMLASAMVADALHYAAVVADATAAERGEDRPESARTYWRRAGQLRAMVEKEIATRL